MSTQFRLPLVALEGGGTVGWSVPTPQPATPKMSVQTWIGPPPPPPPMREIPENGLGFGRDDIDENVDRHGNPHWSAAWTDAASSGASTPGPPPSPILVVSPPAATTGLAPSGPLPVAKAKAPPPVAAAPPVFKAGPPVMPKAKAKAPPPLGLSAHLPTHTFMAAVAMQVPTAGRPMFSPQTVPRLASEARLRLAFPQAVGDLRLRESSSRTCPGLHRSSGLWLTFVRVTRYSSRLGYHHLDLRLVFPPLALLKIIPAAVVMSEAERYFILDDPSPRGLWADSRTILGLKLPAERHALGYALAEFWSNPELTPEPELTPRSLAREVSAATTAIDPTTESDDDAPTSTADLPESPADGSGFERGVAAAEWDDVDRHWAVESHTVNNIGQRLRWLRSARSYSNRMRLRRPFDEWAAAKNVEYAYADGERSPHWFMEWYTRSRWTTATGFGGFLRLQPHWNEMVEAAVASGGQKLTYASILYGWHASFRFRYRMMLAVWAAVAGLHYPLKVALKLAKNPLGVEGKFGSAGRTIAGYLGLET